MEIIQPMVYPPHSQPLNVNMVESPPYRQTGWDIIDPASLPVLSGKWGLHHVYINPVSVGGALNAPPSKISSCSSGIAF